MAFTMTTLMAVMALLAREGWAWDIPSVSEIREGSLVNFNLCVD
jgi:hypothetical protein